MLSDKVFHRLENLPTKEKKALIRGVERFSRKKKFFHLPTNAKKPVPHPIALTPFLISPKIVPLLHRLSKAAYRFQSLVPKLYSENAPGIRDILPLGKNAEKWLLKHYQDDNNKFLIRLDIGLAGVPVVYEVNSTALAGMYNHAVGVDILKSLVFPKIFSSGEIAKIKEPPDLLEFLSGFLQTRKSVAFVEDSDIAGWSEIPQIAEHFRRRVDVSCGNPQELVLDGSQVLLRKKPVDLLYKDMSYNDIKFDGKNAALVELLKRKNVVPSFASEFSHKGLLECLTSKTYHKFLSNDERRLFKLCVPWARVIWKRETDIEGEEVDLLKYIENHKNQLVIKPNIGSSGERVMIGKDISQQRWEKRIQLAAREKGKWVAQKFVDIPTRKMAYLKDGKLYFNDCYFSLGLFYYFDRLGLHCRISPKKIVNVARGGALACVFLSERMQ